jgi:hypothetical protein
VSLVIFKDAETVECHQQWSKVGVSASRLRIMLKVLRFDIFLPALIIDSVTKYGNDDSGDVL